MPEIDGRRESDEAGRRPAARPLFREEALRRHVEAREFGDVVRRPPRWTRIAYPLVVAIALAGALYLGMGRVTRSARGPAVVRAEAHGDPAGYTVVACLPGAFLSELRPGMPLRLEFDGTRDATVELPVESVGDRVLAPAEARRVLDAGPADAIRLPRGGVVLARASLPSGRMPPLAGEPPGPDGTAVNAEIPLGSERLIFSLFPGLRAAVTD